MRSADQTSPDFAALDSTGDGDGDLPHERMKRQQIVTRQLQTLF